MLLAGVVRRVQGFRMSGVEGRRISLCWSENGDGGV